MRCKREALPRPRPPGSGSTRPPRDCQSSMGVSPMSRRAIPDAQRRCGLGLAFTGKPALSTANGMPVPLRMIGEQHDHE